MSDLVEHRHLPIQTGDCTSTARSRPVRGWGVWTVACLLGCFFCANFAHSNDDLEPGQYGFLLLERNRVVQGRITPQGATYSVEQTVGTLIVSAEQVRFVGVDMQSVYVHLQDQLPRPAGPDDHVELARWCVGYRMMSEARFELEAALEIDPSRDDIRRNLTKLDSVLKSPPPESKPVKSQTPAERMAKHAGRSVMEGESLGGLPREAGQIFTRQIQPILMHNCTASACHGPKSDQTFKLSLVHYGGSQQHTTTSKNLLALLPYIDRTSPKSSKLWKLLKTNHGAVGSSIFVGSRGEKQLETFQNWLVSLKQDSDPESIKIYSVAARVQQAAHSTESKPRYRKGAPAPAAPSGIVQATSEQDPPPIPEVLVSSPTFVAGALPLTQTSSPTSSKKPTSSQLPETEPIVSKERPVLLDDIVEDPFNPNEFNSRQRVKKKLGSR